MSRLALLALVAGCAHHTTPDPPDPPAPTAAPVSPHPDLGDERPKPGDEDGDGIPDRDDLCPRFPEDKDGHFDDDGCDDLECEDCCAAFTHNAIEFFPGRTDIPAVEFPLVVAIARTLTARPDLRVIELESWGRLGELRMVAVRDALLKLGIAQSRIRFRTELHRVPPSVFLQNGVGAQVLEGSCTTRVNPDDES